MSDLLYRLNEVGKAWDAEENRKKRESEKYVKYCETIIENFQEDQDMIDVFSIAAEKFGEIFEKDEFKVWTVVKDGYLVMDIKKAPKDNVTQNIFQMPEPSWTDVLRVSYSYDERKSMERRREFVIEFFDEERKKIESSMDIKYSVEFVFRILSDQFRKKYDKALVLNCIPEEVFKVELQDETGKRIKEMQVTTSTYGEMSLKMR